MIKFFAGVRAPDGKTTVWMMSENAWTEIEPGSHYKVLAGERYDWGAITPGTTMLAETMLYQCGLDGYVLHQATCDLADDIEEWTTREWFFISSRQIEAWVAGWTSGQGFQLRNDDKIDLGEFPPTGPIKR